MSEDTQAPTRVVLLKAVVLNRKTGEMWGSVPDFQSEPKIRRNPSVGPGRWHDPALWQKYNRVQSTGTLWLGRKGEGFGARVGAMLRGAKYRPFEKNPRPEMTPHRIAGDLRGVHTSMRGMGLQFQTKAIPKGEGAEYHHTIVHPHASGSGAAQALSERLRATGWKTAPLAAHNGQYMLIAKHPQSGTRHTFLVSENAHVRGVHDIFRQLGVRARSGHDAAKAHRYTHEVVGAAGARATAEKLRGLLGQTHKVTRTTRSGRIYLTATHPVSGVVHHFTLHEPDRVPGA